MAHCYTPVSSKGHWYPGNEINQDVEIAKNNSSKLEFILLFSVYFYFPQNILPHHKLNKIG